MAYGLWPAFKTERRFRGVRARAGSLVLEGVRVELTPFGLAHFVRVVFCLGVEGRFASLLPG